MRDAFPALDHPALRRRAEWEALYDLAQERAQGESDYARQFRAAIVPSGLSDTSRSEPREESNTQEVHQA